MKTRNSNTQIETVQQNVECCGATATTAKQIIELIVVGTKTGF